MSDRILQEGSRLLLRAIVLGVLAAAAVVPRASATETPRRVSLDEALRMFEENSLELRVAAAERDESLGFAKQAGVYPNPTATVSHEGLSTSSLHYSESYFTVSQRLEWPGRRGARVESFVEEAEALGLRLAAERGRLAFEVRRAYVEAAAAEERLAILEELRSVFQRAEESGEARVREGELSGYDLRRLRIERARYENLLSTSKLELRGARLRLSSLVAPSDSEGVSEEVAPSGPPPGRPADFEELPEDAVAFALERRPEVRGADAGMAAAEASLRFLSTFARPDFTVTGGYKRQSDGFGGYLLGLNLPLPVFDRRQGDVQAAESRLAAETARAALARRAVANDVKTALAAYASISERVALVRERILSGVEDLLRIARVSYAEGEMSLLELLDAAEAYRESQITSSDLRAEQWVRYFDLQRAVGGLP